MNKEKYKDPTAEKAIANVIKECRKQQRRKDGAGNGERRQKVEKAHE